MNSTLKTIAAIFLLAFLFSCNKRSGKARVLIFCKPGYFKHESIPAGIAAITKLGAENDFDTDTTTDAGWFNDDSLKKYSAVIFLNTTDKADTLLNSYQKAGFERYIQAGGGFVGIHAAADAEYHWGWYVRMVGASFKNHPDQQNATLNIVDKDNISTKGLPDPWLRKDEWYNYKNLNKDVHVLVTVDEKSYKGGENGEHHPISWYHDYDGGRAWYTGLGHTIESYSEPDFLKHILGGIKYAMGDNKELDYSKVKTQLVPDEDRFTKTSLIQATLFEPTEMTILPNLDILIAQRRGELVLYKNDSKQVKPAGTLQVYWKTITKGVNAEEGLLGLQADPDFKNNHWVYIFYSPVDTSVNRLSRFEFKNDAVDLSSEKILLQFYSQREICCHTGGSIAFGPDRMLFLSSGDNSTPFDEPKQQYVNHGFAPLNDLPGHEQYDARRSAGNTNDLRGKIMRIKIKEDGTYEIPEGNLFPKNTANARPEIYVMGDRNPYRISVDKKNGYLYWGEVGPDANKDSLDVRGPRGYDEVNQARKPGYFGWPLFVGNNYAYHQYNYENGTSGAAFDPAKPVNNSRNNTGLKELPPAQPAFIWYPYDASPDFPQVGSGGRNAMAGPVYYTDMFPESSRYPDYYNKKLFVYDWIRGWIKIITMKPNGDFDKMEPFMGHTKFSNPIDMEVGPDGKLYVLEYGSGWFTKNPDAGLSRLDYNAGNRPPEISAIKVNKLSGTLPFTVTASVDVKDPEKDKLTYLWHFGNGVQKESTGPSTEYSYNVPGEFGIFVEVIDSKKASAKSNVVNIYAGNEEPVVDINIAGNKSFYFPGKPLVYSVAVKQGSAASSSIDSSNINVIADYIEGTDKASVPLGHLAGSEIITGKNIMLVNDCKSCHKENEKSIGPSYTQVAMKYKSDPKATSYLVDKIKKGGSGVWGETAMSAHPDLPVSDLQQVVQWILSLSSAGEKKSSLPPSGKINPILNKPLSDNGVLYLTASYTNSGSTGIKPLTGKKTIVLKNSKINFSQISKMKDYTKEVENGNTYLIPPKGEGWFSIDSIDLSGIQRAELSFTIPPALQSGYYFEIRSDTPDGKKISEFLWLPSSSKVQGNTGLIKFTLEGIKDSKFHDLYIISKPVGEKGTTGIKLSSLRFNE